MSNPILNQLNQREASIKPRDFCYFELNDLDALDDGSLDLEHSDFFCHISHYHQKKAKKVILKIGSIERTIFWEAKKNS